MTEWPEASRLTEALRSRAESIEPADGWSGIVDRLDGVELASPIPIEATNRTQRRRRRGSLLMVAAVVLLLAGLATLVVDRSQAVDIQSDIADDDQPSVQETQPPPLTLPTEQRVFESFDSCSTGVEIAGEHQLDANNGTTAQFRTAIGDVPSGGLGFEVIFALEELSDTIQSESRLQVTEGRVELVNYIDSQQFGSAEELQGFVEAIRRSNCASATPNIVATGPAVDIALSTACLLPQGFQGVVFLDAVPAPPADCLDSGPVFLLNGLAAEEAAIQRWADALGCAEPETVSDAAENVVTRWNSCASTLVHVEVQATSAWEVEEVEGLTVSDFIKSIAKLAG